jgi:ribulose-phosphate 3-epimerase
VEAYLDRIDLLLIMTVEPGFGGQAFMPGMLEKIEEAYEARERRQAPFRIQVDGGITLETGKQCVRAGADTLVAGTSLFRAQNMAEAIRQMRRPYAESGTGLTLEVGSR